MKEHVLPSLILVVVLVTGKVLAGGERAGFEISAATGGSGCGCGWNGTATGGLFGTEYGMSGVAGGIYLGVCGAMGTCTGGGLQEGEGTPGVRGWCGGERHCTCSCCLQHGQMSVGFGEREVNKLV